MVVVLALFIGVLAILGLSGVAVSGHRLRNDLVAQAQGTPTRGNKPVEQRLTAARASRTFYTGFFLLWFLGLLW